MVIGSLLDPTLNKKITYSYCERGTDITLNPDITKEVQDLPVYDYNSGNLFYGRIVAWSKNTLVNRGVDIKFNIGEKAFIDHIVLNQTRGFLDLEGESYKLRSVEVFTIEDKEYKKIGKYTPETGTLIETEEFTVKVGTWCDNVVLRLNTEEVNVVIKKVDIYAAWDIEDAVWPLPENMEITKETFAFDSLKTICAKNEDEKFVAEYLNESLDFKFDKTLEISETEGEITFEIEGDGYDDGYTLTSKDGKVAITGKNRRSLLYAVSALVQLIDGDKVKCADINHTAFRPLRGFHTGTPCKDQVGFFKSFIKNVLVPLHYNMLFLEIAGTLEYEKYPEINKTFLQGLKDFKEGKRKTIPAHGGMLSQEIWTKKELRELCEFMESYGVEVVPEVQSHGHVQYITSAFPEMGEFYAPGVNPLEGFTGFGAGDAGPNKAEYHTMCPNHPKYYEVIFNIIDEVVEAVQPKRFVHIGHDEVFPMGVCPICKNIPQAEIYTKETNTLNAYIKKKGYRTMMWGDNLQDNFYQGTTPCVRTIDKDIIILDFVWYYDLKKDFEDTLVRYGYNIMIGNFYSGGYERYESRIRKPGMLGGQVSTWTKCCEDSIGFLGKFFDLCFGANMLINSQYDHNMRLTYTELIKPFIKDMRIKVAGLKTKGNETKIALNGKGSNIPYDVRGILPYESAISVNINNNEEVIDVNKKGNVISIIHATDRDGKRTAWVQDPSIIGKYVIEYEDGTTAEDTIVYSKNIHHYHSRYGMPVSAKCMFSHQEYHGTYFTFPISGKTYDGDDYTIGQYLIKNNYPEKTIKDVKVVHNQKSDPAIIVFEVALIK